MDFAIVVARVWQKAYQLSLGMVRGKEEKRRPEKIREKFSQENLTDISS